MSIFVALDRNKYPDSALNAFTPTSQFNLENARGMMWLSQLAYETESEPKVKDILKAWQLTERAFVSNDPRTGLPPHSACVVVARRPRRDVCYICRQRSGEDRRLRNGFRSHAIAGWSPYRV
jgi:hypothetical protein